MRFGFLGGFLPDGMVSWFVSEKTTKKPLSLQWYGILFSRRVSDENSSLVFKFFQLLKWTSYHTSHNDMVSWVFWRISDKNSINIRISVILQENSIPYHCEMCDKMFICSFQLKKFWYLNERWWMRLEKRLEFSSEIL